MLASFRSGAPLFTEALANSQNNAPYASKKTKTPAPADLQANPGLVQLTKFVSFNCGLHHTYSKSPPTRDRALAKAHSKSPLTPLILQCGLERGMACQFLSYNQSVRH